MGGSTHSINSSHHFPKQEEAPAQPKHDAQWERVCRFVSQKQSAMLLQKVARLCAVRSIFLFVPCCINPPKRTVCHISGTGIEVVLQGFIMNFRLLSNSCPLQGVGYPADNQFGIMPLCFIYTCDSLRIESVQIQRIWNHHSFLAGVNISPVELQIFAHDTLRLKPRLDIFSAVKLVSDIAARPCEVSHGRGVGQHCQLPVK